MNGFFRSMLARWPRRRSRADDAVDFQAIAENSLDLIVRCGFDEIATYVSPASIAMLGIRPEELIGRSHLEFVHPEDRAMMRDAAARHVAGEKDGRITFRVIRKDGTIIWVQGRGRTVVDKVTGTSDLLVVMRDVTESKLAEEKLAALAMTDALTGLANRRAFDEALEREWRRTKRSGTSLSLLLLDVDCFKSFNDHYGHQVGDDCLRAVASAIAGQIRRPGDLAARYGGEEIAVIVPETGSESAMHVAEGIRAAIEALAIPHAESAVDRHIVTVSIGVATALSRAGASMQMPTGLLQAADIALYKAKRNGRNRVEPAMILTADESRANAA